MPQPFKGAVVTDAGMQLLTKAQAGEIKIEFTRMETGNGIYEEREKDPEQLKAMAENIIILDNLHRAAAVIRRHIIPGFPGSHRYAVQHFRTVFPILFLRKQPHFIDIIPICNHSLLRNRIKICNQCRYFYRIFRIYRYIR